MKDTHVGPCVEVPGCPAVSDSDCVCPHLRQPVLESLDNEHELIGPLCVGEERNHERHQNVEGRANRDQLCGSRPALERPRCSGSVFLLWTLSPITVNKRVLLLRRSGVWMRGHRHRIPRRKEANGSCHHIFPKERSAGHKINLFLFSFLQQTSS